MLQVVIPAYEPDEKLLGLIDALKEKMLFGQEFGILIVNDGSSAKYGGIFDNAAQKGCTLLTHKINRGKGAALKTAFSYLLEKEYLGFIVCADCDGQHRPEDIKKVAASLEENPRDLILGCRDFIGKVPLKSRLGNSLTGIIYSFISGQNLKDTQTGLRAFSAVLLPWLVKLKGNRYEYEMNQLLEAKDEGIRLCCISIETVYENKNAGTHFHPVRDSIRIYMPLLKYLMSSLLAGILDFACLFLFMKITDNLLFSVVAARVISSAVNFFCNKTLVFNKKDAPVGKSLIKYYLLAAFILLCNYSLIRLFTYGLSFPLAVSKILTEVLLFLLGYKIQKSYIFKKECA